MCRYPQPGEPSESEQVKSQKHSPKTAGGFKVVEQVRASQLAARSSRKVMRSSVKQPGDLRG